jgi:hypothetical protein
MANTPAIFYEGTIASTDTEVLYTVPANTTAMLGYITVCNTTDDTVKVHLGGGANYTYWFYEESVRKAGDEMNPLEISGPRVLTTTNFLFIKADTADAIDVYVDGWVKT